MVHSRMETPGSSGQAEGYRKPDKKYYEKWMSNADISESLQSIQPSADTVEVTRRLIKEGVVEPDTELEFEQFIMRFQLPKEDVPGFCEEELMKLADTLGPQADVPQEVESLDESGTEVGTTHDQCKRNVSDDLNSAAQSNGGGVNMNCGGVAEDRTDYQGHAINTANDNSVSIGSLSSQIAAITMKREILTPPKDETPPPEMYCSSSANASQPEQWEIRESSGSNSGSHVQNTTTSSVVTTQASSTPSSATQQRVRPGRPIMSRPRFRIVSAPYCNSPRHGHSSVRIPATGQPTGTVTTGGAGALNQNQQHLMSSERMAVFTTTTLAPPSSLITRNHSVSTVCNMMVGTTNNNMQARPAPTSTTMPHMTGGIIIVQNGRMVTTAPPRHAPIQMCNAYTPPAFGNPVQLGSLASTMPRQPPPVMSRVQVQLPTPNPRCHTLQLSPYITGMQADQRVQEIGLEAAQREIYNFAALINARRQAEVQSFSLSIINQRGEQRHPVRFIHSPVQLQMGHPNPQTSVRGQVENRGGTAIRAPHSRFNCTAPGGGNTSNFTHFHPY